MKTYLTASMFAALLVLCAITGAAQQPELVVQTGHSGFINSVAFSHDGRFFASCSSDNTIKLWDLASGRELRTFRARVDLIAFSRDGKSLISVGSDMKLWDLNTGGVRTVADNGSEGFLLKKKALSADGKTLVVKETGGVAVWDVSSGVKLRTLTAPDDIDALDLSADGKVLVIKTQSVDVWDLTTGDAKPKFSWMTDILAKPVPYFPKVLVRDGAVAVSANGNIVAATTRENTLTVWDTSTGRELRSFITTGSSSKLALSPDGHKLLSSASGNNGMIQLWDIATSQVGPAIFAPTLLGFSMDGKTLAGTAGYPDFSIKLWDVNTGKEGLTLRAHSHSVEAAAFVDASQIIAIQSGHEAVKLWSANTGGLLRSLKRGSEQIKSIAVSPDGKTLIGVGWLTTVKIWDIATGHELHEFVFLCESVAFGPDGKTLACGRYDGIMVLDVDGWREQYVLTSPHGRQSVAFGVDGKILALKRDYDANVEIWNVASRQLLRTIKTPNNSESLAVSANGKTFAVSQYLNGIKTWDVSTGSEGRAFIDRSFGSGLALNGDASVLAGATSDDTIKLWDLTTGRELHALTGHYTTIRSLAFNSDGTLLISGSWDGSAKLWRVGSGELLATLISLDEEDWAVVTPDGRFDASPNAQKLMHWMVGTEPIELEQLKERYYEPGLLSKLMGFNKEPMKDVSALRDVKLFPQVEYGEPDGGKLKIKLTSRGGGIGKVRVLVNGKEIAADARGPSANPQASQATLSVDLSGASIIPGKPNSVEVVAWNSEGYLSSKGGEIKWTPPGDTNEAAAHPDLYAIVVGISDYAGDSFDLQFAAKDAADIAQALRIGAGGLFGVNKTHITLLNTSGKEGALLPTKENIRRAFAEVAKQAKPWDVLVIYFSGHGLALGGEEDLYVYPTQEARTIDGETLKDTALRNVTTINSTELVEWLTQTEWIKGQKGLAPLKRVMILDTCAAGKAGEKLMKDATTLSSAQIRAIDRLKDRTGYHVLMGAAADKVSYETNRYGQSLLTYALLTGMRGAALRQEQYVDVALLFQYAADQVPQLARGIGGVQRPIVAAKQGTSFDVGLLKTKEERSAIPLARERPTLLRPLLINRDESVGFDDLELQPLLRERLREKSAGKGASASDVWVGVSVDADEMAGAVRPSGTYVVVGDTVRVAMSLVRDGKRIDSFQVEGNKADKDGLVRLILEGIARSMKKLESELVNPGP